MIAAALSPRRLPGDRAADVTGPAGRRGRCCRRGDDPGQRGAGGRSAARWWPRGHPAMCGSGAAMGARPRWPRQARRRPRALQAVGGETAEGDPQAAGHEPARLRRLACRYGPDVAHGHAARLRRRTELGRSAPSAGRPGLRRHERVRLAVPGASLGGQGRPNWSRPAEWPSPVGAAEVDRSRRRRPACAAPRSTGWTSWAPQASGSRSLAAGDPERPGTAAGRGRGLRSARPATSGANRPGAGLGRVDGEVHLASWSR